MNDEAASGQDVLPAPTQDEINEHRSPNRRGRDRSMSPVRKVPMSAGNVKAGTRRHDDWYLRRSPDRRGRNRSASPARHTVPFGPEASRYQLMPLNDFIKRDPWSEYDETRRRERIHAELERSRGYYEYGRPEPYIRSRSSRQDPGGWERWNQRVAEACCEYARAEEHSPTARLITANAITVSTRRRDSKMTTVNRAHLQHRTVLRYLLQITSVKATRERLPRFRIAILVPKRMARSPTMNTMVRGQVRKRTAPVKRILPSVSKRTKASK